MIVRGVTDGKTSTLIFPKELDKYVELGYHLGRSIFSEPGNKGRKASEELCKKLSLAHRGLQKGSKGINNGATNKGVSQENIKEYLRSGGKEGRTKNAKR